MLEDQLGDGAADRAQARDADAQWHHCAASRLTRVSAIAGPALRNLRTLRAACLMRCSFSTSAMRTCASPYSPKPTPGATATLACSSSSFENRSEPSGRKASGIGAQANIDAGG